MIYQDTKKIFEISLFYEVPPFTIVVAEAMTEVFANNS